MTLFAGDVLFDEVGMLQARELDGEAVFDVAHDAALRLADVTTTPTGGRRSAAIPIAAPDCDRSMMRQATLVPFGRIRRATDCAARSGRGGGLPAD